VVKTYPASGAVITGSYAHGTASAHVVSDRVGQPACNTASGLKGFKFSGLGGVSTFQIPNTASAQSAATPIFSDEFNGTALDLTKWRANWLGTANGSITKPVNTAEESCYDPAQVSESGGYLHLKAVDRSCPASNGVTYPYASGLVETRDHFTFTYGHMEARVWFPPGSGAAQNWGAFWAYGTGTFPTTGELDVVEALNGRACYHFHSTNNDPGGCPAMADSGGWHIFAADWRAGSVTYSYDGVQVGRITSGITAAPMFMILNLAVSSAISGPVVVPSEMLVDYVRVTG
jgi:beta-glucanase (GH16 family)